MGMVASSLRELLEQLKPARSQGKRIVFTNGCFDILHVGHIRLLEGAKRQGDILVVAVNSGEYVRQAKGEGRPVFPEAERKEILAALQAVDFVIGFGEQTSASLIRQIRPDVFVKGADYQSSLPEEERRAAEEVGATILFLPLVPGRASTEIAGKMRGGGSARRSGGASGLT